MAVLRNRKIAPHAHESRLQALRRKAGQHVSPKWDHHGESLPRFKAYCLENPGVLCYRNSLIQSLFHIPKFANWLKFHHPICPLPQDCMACLLKNLLNTYWTSDADQLQSRRNRAAGGLQGCITTRGFYPLFGNRGAWYKSTRHQDSLELWSFMFQAFIGQLPRDKDFLDSMFETVYRKTRSCPVCPSTHDEPEDRLRELSLMFPNSSPTSHWTLPQLIHYNLSLTTNAHEGFTSEQCGHTGNFPVRSTILAAPDILIVNLIRYGYSAQGGFSAENNTYEATRIEAPVKFRQYMSTLTKYHDGGAQLKYELVAVIMHQGTMVEGHFVTVAKSPRGSWYWVEDEHVPWKVGFEEAVSGRIVKGMLPYMLFYKKVVRQVAIVEEELGVVELTG